MSPQNATPMTEAELEAKQRRAHIARERGIQVRGRKSLAPCHLCFCSHEPEEVFLHTPKHTARRFQVCQGCILDLSAGAGFLTDESHPTDYGMVKSLLRRSGVSLTSIIAEELVEDRTARLMMVSLPKHVLLMLFRVDNGAMLDLEVRSTPGSACEVRTELARSLLVYAETLQGIFKLKEPDEATRMDPDIQATREALLIWDEEEEG